MMGDDRGRGWWLAKDRSRDFLLVVVEAGSEVDRNGREGKGCSGTDLEASNEAMEHSMKVNGSSSLYCFYL